jgi:hypothetical protein
MQAKPRGLPAILDAACAMHFAVLGHVEFIHVAPGCSPMRVGGDCHFWEVQAYDVVQPTRGKINSVFGNKPPGRAAPIPPTFTLPPSPSPPTPPPRLAISHIH